MTWYHRTARDLPWRRTRDAYAIWVSEIMLQQTQVDTAIPYFLRFLKAFPNVETLARASEERVLKLWEGLGYYRRARFLQNAARYIVDDLKGVFPKNAREWQALPGIGPYTAGAIASIALQESTAIVDGNVKRILARIFKIEENVDHGSGLETVWELAGELVPASDPGGFNQSMMELGALVCKPEKPDCGQCPVMRLCAAYQTGTPEKWPIRSTATPKPHKKVVVGILVDKHRVLIGKRPLGGLLGGMWEFPGGHVQSGETLERALLREFWEEVGLKISVLEKITVVKHAYSHFSITMHAFYVRKISGTLQVKYHQQLQWATSEQLDAYAFPVANQKILKKLEIA